MGDNGWIVVKVGGSLFDLPDLGTRLAAWLRQFEESNVLLVPGGGAAADAIRDFDRVHQLGEETSHWLAIQALSLNGECCSDCCRNHGLLPIAPRSRFGLRANFHSRSVSVFPGGRTSARSFAA